MIQSYRQYCGQLGEQAAKRHIETLGWQVIAQNWRFKRMGEIDLIALDLEKSTLHFIEVKTRHTNGETGSPLEALSEAKLNRLVQLVENYLHQDSQNQSENSISIDLFAVWTQGNQIINTVFLENVIN